MRVSRSAPLLLALALAACGESNVYVPPPPPEVTVAKPETRNVTEYFEATGSLAAIETVEIRARVQGFIDKIHFTPGERVESGDILFTIDPRQYQADVDSKEAELEAAQAEAELQEALLERVRYAAERKAVAEADLLVKQAERNKAAADVDVQKAYLENAQIELSYTEVHAPVPGRVGINEVDRGQLVGANEATLLTTVLNDTEVWAYFNVNEQDLLRLIRKYGRDDEADEDATPVFLRLLDETEFTHEGAFDSAENQINPETGTLRARARFSSMGGLLVPGAFVRVRIPIGEDDALLVPEVALGADQGGRYVLVVNDENVVEKRPVKVGRVIEGMAPIEAGLEADVRVIVNGMLRARPGAEVTPKDQAVAGDAGTSG